MLLTHAEPASLSWPTVACCCTTQDCAPMAKKIGVPHGERGLSARHHMPHLVSASQPAGRGFDVRGAQRARRHRQFGTPCILACWAKRVRNQHLQMRGKGGNRDWWGGVWLYLGGFFARCPPITLLGRSSNWAPCGSLLGGAWSQCFPIIIHREPQLLLKGPELPILCCLSCCRRCLEGPGHCPSWDHRRLSCFLCLPWRIRCSARNQAQGSADGSSHCWARQCSCLMTNCLTCCLASCQARGSEGYYCCHCESFTGWRPATWPWRRTRPSYGGLTVTWPRRRKKMTLHCWKAGFLRRTRDGTRRVDCHCLQGNWWGGNISSRERQIETRWKPGTTHGMGELEWQAEPRWEHLGVPRLPIWGLIQHSSAPSREYCGPVIVSKIGPGPLGTPVLWLRIVSVRGTAERKKSSTWAFVIVRGRNEGQFLLAAARRTEAVMVMMKVVVIVGCFAASTACFLLTFGWNMPDPL